MNVKITYYLDVISSWCFWAEPAWSELKQRFAGRVDFTWKIALMDPSGLPTSLAQEDWFYRRSGTIMRSPTKLSTGWFETERRDYFAANAVVEAARGLGNADDGVRLALARAAMVDGRKIGHWDEAVAVAAQASGLAPTVLSATARSRQVEEQLRASTAEFFSFQVNQRPAFLIEDGIGDRAVFSGLAVAAPLAATIEAMLDDTAAYASYAAHHGEPPKV